MTSRRTAEASYRPKGYGISPSLARARAPFRVQNAITGATLFGFAIAVWAYSINAVKQDNFDDVDFTALNTSVEEKARRVSLEDEAKAKAVASQVKATAHTPQAEPLPKVVDDTPKSTSWVPGWLPWSRS